MAEMTGTTVGILVRIGTGEAVEVAQIDVPMRATLMGVDPIDSGVEESVRADVVVDWGGFNDGVRSALLQLADKMPVFGSDEIGTAPGYRCPTCQVGSRETVDMQCQTCGRDYSQVTTGE